MLQNWKDKTGGDEDLIDGLDELPTEAQEKVKRALEQGHVDDEDWKGVSDIFSVPPTCLLTTPRTWR